MNRIMQVGQTIVPEAMALLERRFNILRAISKHTPMGRRLLAEKVGLSERVARAETDFLSRQGLIEIQPRGMIITPEGRAILEQLLEFMEEFLGLEELAGFLVKRLGLRQVLLVPGDSDADPAVLEEIGRTASGALVKVLTEKSIIAITGGNTVKQMVEQFPDLGRKFPEVLVVPARGGVGRSYGVQSNTLVGRLADKLGGGCRLLNLPDSISNGALDTMLGEREVRETVALIQQADLVVAGVGDALIMAQNRNLPEADLAKLKAAQAKGEFFGGYYDRTGHLVKQHRSVGLSMEAAGRARQVFVLAGGKGKAPAIHSIDFHGLPVTLVTDEGAARALVELIQSSAAEN